MKIRFYHNNIEVLFNRISGKFNIKYEKGTMWNDKLIKGSFRICNDVLYDKILKKITEIKHVEWHQYYREHNKKVWKCFRDKDFKNNLVDTTGFLVFTVENGMIKDVEVENPKQSICHDNFDEYHLITFSTYEIFILDDDMKTLPKYVRDKMKEVDKMDDDEK